MGKNWVARAASPVIHRRRWRKQRSRSRARNVSNASLATVDAVGLMRAVEDRRWIQSIERRTNENRKGRQDGTTVRLEEIARARARAREDAEWSLLRRIQSPCEKRRDRRLDRLCMHHAGVHPGKCGTSLVVALLVATGGRIELHLRAIFTRFGRTWDFPGTRPLSFFLAILDETKRVCLRDSSSKYPAWRPEGPATMKYKNDPARDRQLDLWQIDRW